MTVRAFLIVAFFASSVAGTASGADTTVVDSLARHARALLVDDGGVESRIAALRSFDRATSLAPERGDLWLEFGRACIRMGRPERAHACLLRAARLTPGDPAVWAALGEAWKEKWLAHVDRSSLDSARACFARAAALAPEDAPAWTALSALALLRGDPSAALRAGLRALEAAPGATRPRIAIAAALFRMGHGASADSAFRAAFLNLDEPLDLRLTDGGFDWNGNDPDLTTAENEARLEYLTRLSIVLYLFDDGGALRWDQRAEMFVRYGPPSSVEFNPAWAQLGRDELEYHYSPTAVRPFYAPPPIGFPYDMQVWYYPELGMSVELWDRWFKRIYELPFSNVHDAEPSPDPLALAERGDLIALDDGRGVFRTTPPNSRPLALRAACARFPSGAGLRLLGSLRADAAPGDSLWGAWALADSSGRVLARETRRLDPANCRPEEGQVGAFTTELPPGLYRVDFAAWDGRGRYGLERREVRVGSPPPGLALSDLVLLCGSPIEPQPQSVRLEPALSGRLSGAQFAGYCEISGLTPAADGTAVFTYRSLVLAVDRKGLPRARPAFEASRDVEHRGSHRRQFITVPIANLPSGEYEFVIEVTDRANGATARQSTRFVKEAQ